ncbi:MAG: ATP-binding cassette domain-containing protein [Pseudomonadota bacterium]
MVTLEDVRVARGTAQMLGPIDLTLGAGGTTALMGPNGAGKTTFLKVLHGLERPRTGRVIWQDVAPQQQSFVSQRPILLRRSVRENLELPLSLRGELSAKRVKAISAKLGLTDLLPLHAPRLSGGEAQKLALARALITEPRVLFLDEPTANLDGPTIKAMEAIFAEQAATGMRLFIATHSVGQAKRLADDVLWAEAGRVSGPFPADQFFADPPDPARDFLDAQ